MSQSKKHNAEQVYDEAIELRFQEESQQYNFRYTCDDCMHFNAKEERCMDFYPTERLRIENHPVRLGEKDWLFCKCFEMN